MQVKEHTLGEERAKETKVCVTTGSQEALTKCFEMLMEEGDSVLVESPTYSGALAALQPMNLNLVGVETDGGGLRPESLEEILSQWDASRQGAKPRVLYTIPTGSNPTGAIFYLLESCAFCVFSFVALALSLSLCFCVDTSFFFHFFLLCLLFVVSASVSASLHISGATLDSSRREASRTRSQVLTLISMLTCAPNRQTVYRIACEHDILILEDDPYWHLQFCHHDKRPDSFLAADTEGRVLRFDSMSKILSSGLRLGWATGPAPLIDRLELHGQSSSLHASGISQAVVLALLQRWEADGNGWERHLENVRSFYAGRREAFMAAADRHLTGLAEWSVPAAGMFAWIKLLGIEDSEALIMERALEEKVLMVPGTSFMPNSEKSGYVRAAFSTATPEQIDTALERLAKLLVK